MDSSGRDAKPTGGWLDHDDLIDSGVAPSDSPYRLMQDGTRPVSPLHPTSTPAATGTGTDTDTDNPAHRTADHADVGGTINDRLDLRPATVRRLFENWKVKMHVLHPFVDINSLELFVIQFLQHNRSASSEHTHRPHGDAHGPKSGAANKKRKRSDSNVDDSSIVHQSFQFCNNHTVGRSLKQAILYLILALGKVVETPYSPSAASPAGSSSESRSASRASPRQDPAGRPERPQKSATNVETVPGLAYYREACLILGLYADSNALGCAQARLLAGLYKGQLARVRESWSWYHDASRICRYHIVKQKLDKGVASIPPPEDTLDGLARRENMLLVLCWSCLQLESDILAEFDYPHSGLSAHEADLPYPRLRFCVDGAPESEAETSVRIEHHYLGQLYLRKRLNELHVNIYGKSLALQSKERLVEVLEENEAAIESWKDLSIKMSVSIEQWDEDDAPSDDLLTARLRGKYYGARYIALRPFLDYSLHAMEQLKTGKTLEELAVDAQGNPRQSELALFRAINTMSVSTVQDKAKTCVESAMHSTIAFDNVPGRLTITNIVGTAHAQFGNMLVLSATYASGASWLSNLVPATKLKALLDRTIAFLDQIKSMSPTARTDLDILRRIKMHLFPTEAIGEKNGAGPRDSRPSSHASGVTNRNEAQTTRVKLAGTGVDTSMTD